MNEHASLHPALPAIEAALRATLGDVPTTCGLVSCTAVAPPAGVADPTAAICTVRIRWDDTRGTGGGAEQTVEIVSQI